MSFIKDFNKLDRHAQFIIIASLGPIIVILIAAIIGRRPSFLWLTTMSVPFVAFWAFSASRATINHETAIRRTIIAALLLEVFSILTFTAVRYITPITSKNLYNQEIDSRKLTKIAMEYWDKVSEGPIPFIVSLGKTQMGFQRAGGIVFDLPYRVEILPDGDPENAPWLDLSRLEEQGALIISQKPIPIDFIVLGQKIVDRQVFEIPVLRNAPKKQIFFARSVPKLNHRSTP